MSVNDIAPRVSIVMANYNGAAHIAAAVRSVLRQTETSLELIVSDDGSDDDSLACARAAADGDPRLVVVGAKRRSGPAAARNRALAVARGGWLAIVDNDDYIEPGRLARLIDAAEADGADIAADDLLVFYEDGSQQPHAHLRGGLAQRPSWIDAAAYERSNRLLGPGPALGYLKPVLRRSLAPHYDETLRIGEDSDLILRLLIGGARMRVYPELGYFYRKHARSISHRLDLAAIEAFDSAYAKLDPGADRALAREFSRGAAARADARAFTQLVAALKGRELPRAAGVALARPSALRLLKDPIAARLPRRWQRPRTAGPPRITLLSRQRIVGPTNGSSAYVLALAGALKQAGYAIDYVGASPKIFGRWAVLRLQPEIEAGFDRYSIHGGLKLGRLVLARDPRVWLSSAQAVADALLRKLGIAIPGLSRPAEYAQGASPARADHLFVARTAAPNAQAVLCDYAFLAPLAPYALSPSARTAVIMHDLMSARIGDAAEANPVQVSAEREFALLGLADAVIAIQRDEAEKVQAALPHRTVLLAPHAAAPVPAPQPGEDDSLLFVGSNTAPNIVGLGWFFRDIWPAIRAARPDARLRVAGSVARAFSTVPEGVAMLGVVRDLAPLYAGAGVIISPLYTGSGLKVKLVEALAAGKAVVATSVTAQGVERQVAGAIALADDPAGFASAATALLASGELRAELATRALACATAHFSAQACFSELTAFVDAAALAPARKPLQPAVAQSQ